MTKQAPRATKTPTVTVIIPVYNGEQYLQRCLDSVYAQTYQDYEIIAVNDGSRDGSLAILEQNTKARPSRQLTILSQKNHGQGHARNQAMEKARGTYLLFLDADDLIQSEALALAVKRAEADEADVVHLGWELLPPGKPPTFQYEAAFEGVTQLVGKECDDFIKMKNFFSVNNLYRRSFLQSKQIHYDEGHIYEDNIFITQVANRATVISFIHRPLYTVCENPSSTTRIPTVTNKHCKDHIRAVSRSFALLQPRLPYTTFYLAAYHLEKLAVYYRRRIPARYRRAYTRAFVDAMSRQGIRNPDGTDNRFLRLCLRYDVFSSKRYGLFRLLVLVKVYVVPAAAWLRKQFRGVQ